VSFVLPPPWQLPSLRLLNPKVPRDLETICRKCLEKEPGNRYTDGHALADDLERLLKGEPIRARRVSVVGRFARWCRRKPALAATQAGALLVIGLVATVSYSRVVAERDRYQRERDQAQANLYRSLVGEARAQMQARDTGWWWKALDNIRAASQLDVGTRDTAELRELAVECMGSPYPCFRLRATWAGHQGPVTALELSPDNRLAASGSRDRTVRIWSVAEDRSLAELSGHTEVVTGVAFHSDGQRLASCSADGTLRLWDLRPLLAVSDEGAGPERPARQATGESSMAIVFEPKAGILRAVAFSPTANGWRRPVPMPRSTWCRYPKTERRRSRDHRPGF
jgi:hypothetical protein